MPQVVIEYPEAVLVLNVVFVLLHRPVGIEAPPLLFQMASHQVDHRKYFLVKIKRDRPQEKEKFKRTHH
jgi:hypothetical protein